MIKVLHYPASLAGKICLSVYQDESLKKTVHELFDRYALVAEVHVDLLNEAFSATVSKTDAWWVSPGLIFKGSPEYGDKGCRDTRAGDVLIKRVEGREEGWIVATTGYIRLEIEHPLGLLGFASKEG
jgi:hypothetical protein